MLASTHYHPTKPPAHTQCAPFTQANLGETYLSFWLPIHSVTRPPGAGFLPLSASAALPSCGEYRYYREAQHRSVARVPHVPVVSHVPLSLTQMFYSSLFPHSIQMIIGVPI